MIKFLNSLNKVIIAIIGFVMVIILGLLDLITGLEYSFAIFYLIPISFTTWYIGNKYGIFFSIISSIAWLNADMQLIERYANPSAPYWNALARLVFFLVVVILIGQLKKLEIGLENKVDEKTADLINEIEERKKAETELLKKTNKLSELANRVLKMQDEQNIHIAREIHDELGQAMTSIKIDLMWLSKRESINPETVKSILSITTTVDEAISTIRKISSNLRPKLLDQLGFSPAVERYLKDFKTRTGINYELKIDREDFGFNEDESNTLFRIFQEAMTNITRHSDASYVEVCMRTNNGSGFNMYIKDNGRGIPEQYYDKEESLGILGMKERAQNIGGNVDIMPCSEGGTIVNVLLPNLKWIKN
jgi:signal transduction histidine kinase